MELENKKIKIAVHEGNVMAFKYQSTCCEEVEVDEIPEEYLNEDIFFNNVNRFYVEDGVVKRRTDEECQAYAPDTFNEVKNRELQERFKNETDNLMYDIIEKLADKFKADIPEVEEWVTKKNAIRAEVK